MRLTNSNILNRCSTESFGPISRSKIFRVHFFAVLVFCLTSCVQMHSHSILHAEHFRKDTLFIKNIHVLAYSDSTSQNVGELLSENLVRQFKNQGIEATSEVQQRNSTIPSSNINLANISKSSPDAIVLIRFGESYSSSTGNQTWAVDFDVLDPQSKGVWKGIVHLYRLDKMHETSESICIQVISNLIGSGVLTLKKSGKETEE